MTNTSPPNPQTEALDGDDYFANLLFDEDPTPLHHLDGGDICYFPEQLITSEDDIY